MNASRMRATGVDSSVQPAADAGSLARGRGWRSGARRLALGCAAALSAAGFTYSVYLGLTWSLRASPAEAAIAERAIEVARGRIAETVVASGRLEPQGRVVIQSEVPGIVAAVHVDEGQRIEAGKPLVELDRGRIEHQAAALKAAVERARALADEDLVGQAQSELEYTRSERWRMEEMFRSGVISPQQVEALRHRQRVNEIALKSARSQVQARAAAVVQAEEEYRRVERDLERSVIRAPVDGVVVTLGVDVGSAVADIQNGGTQIAVLADDRVIHLYGEVDESDIARIRVGQAAEVRVDALPGETLRGSVSRVASAGAVSDKIAMFHVAIALPADPRVRVGMSADARITVAEHEDVLVIPTAAISNEADVARVRRVDPRDARRVDEVVVREGYSDGSRSIVVEGLAAGDRVLLREGAGGK